MQAPPGCSRYAVELRKPLGLVLEEDRHGSIYVVRGQSGTRTVTSICQPRLGARRRPCHALHVLSIHWRAGRTWQEAATRMRRL